MNTLTTNGEWTLNAFIFTFKVQNNAKFVKWTNFFVHYTPNFFKWRKRSECFQQFENSCIHSQLKTRNRRKKPVFSLLLLLLFIGQICLCTCSFVDSFSFYLVRCVEARSMCMFEMFLIAKAVDVVASFLVGFFGLVNFVKIGINSFSLPLFYSFEFYV